MFVAWYVQAIPVTQNSKEAEAKIFCKQKAFSQYGTSFFPWIRRTLNASALHSLWVLLYKCCSKTEFSLLLEETFRFSDQFIHQFLLNIVHKQHFSDVIHLSIKSTYRSRGEGKNPDLLFLAKGLDLHKLLSVGAPVPCYSQATPSLILEHQLIQLSASPWSLQRNQSHAWWLPSIRL